MQQSQPRKRPEHILDKKFQCEKVNYTKIFIKIQFIIKLIIQIEYKINPSYFCYMACKEYLRKVKKTFYKFAKPLNRGFF